MHLTSIPPTWLRLENRMSMPDTLNGAEATFIAVPPILDPSVVYLGKDQDALEHERRYAS